MSSFNMLMVALPRSTVYRIRPGMLSYLNGLLDATYGQNTRSYHGYDHIVGLVELATQHATIPQMGTELDDLIVAIIFHDIIYDLHAQPGFNEQASAAMTETTGPMIFTDLNWQHVNDLIMATVHDGKLQRPDEQWMADLDLAGLSADYDSFVRDATNIIEEYSFAFPEPEVINGRIQFLMRFMSRPRIYYFPGKFSEIVARRNMERDIERLSKMLE